MNENCKYCKTADTCLENAEYNSIYCQLHKRIPKVIGKNYEELLKENQQLKEQLEKSEKARKEASNILKDYIPDEYIRSCDTSDGIGRYELDTESWQYKIYEILDIDKGEIINGKY